MGPGTGGFAFNDGTLEDAWCIGHWLKAKIHEGLLAGIMPMSRTTFKTIEGKFEKEVSFGGCKGASMWRFDYIFFIVR